MDDAGDIAQYRQEDVDEEIGIATALKEDTQRWEDDGKNDLADVAVVRAMLAMISMYDPCWSASCASQHDCADCGGSRKA